MQVKLVIAINKRDDISYEEFDRYWSEEHPKLFLKVPVYKDKLITYSQFHIDRSNKEELKKLGLPVASYDGLVTMVVNSLENLVQIFNDDEYKRLVAPDESKFVKRSEAQVMIGYDILKHDNYVTFPEVFK
ncbi:uncharacterized protein A1O9_11489 [Exophiala aquamarina CBS 119918]|uniref:EthD domain-containing protein n=1 Tax=Exophiala aquamarina CBS 119918 TaxID=1182545 RepID=A0A072NWK6_9EURO|nr:uncharacterized protein A1O9_11489 [Exophiala aquamarina CBS 119918]KEF52249.1 hypothetical protein A1O9_11489 [Exophiala aquamarina CBS 119918]